MAQRSIAVRLSLIVVVLTSLVMATTGTVNYLFQRQRGLTHLDASAANTARRLSDAVHALLWDLDKSALNNAVTAEFGDTSVAGVRICEGADAAELLASGKDPGGRIVAGAVRSADGSVTAGHERPVGDQVIVVTPVVHEGRTIGAVEVALSREGLMAELRQSLLTIILELMVTGLLILVGLALAIRSVVTRPLGQVVEVLEAMADGDTSRRVPEGSSLELARLAVAVNRTVQDMRDLLAAIARKSEELAGSSEQMDKVSNQFSASATETQAQAQGLAEHAKGVAMAIASVASASEQMLASIREIAKTTSDATGVGGEAARLIVAANAKMQELGVASQEINSVAKTIATIAGQTNLLALNATIEAARAGESGRGFAVVAGEVKELARQTAKATAEITPRLAAIQARVTETIEEIARISGIIQHISELQQTVASAVEEQTTTTEEIGRSVHNASGGAKAIADGSATLETAAKDTSTSADQAHGAAQALSALAADLKRMAKS